MTPEDRMPFLEIVIGFAELKGKSLSAAALELYWRAMQRWSLEDFRKAADHLLMSCEFMPTPKDFEDLRKAGRKTPGEAWAEAIQWVRTGAYRREENPDSSIDRAVRAMGGYQVVAMHDEDKLHFLERRFCDHYETLIDAEDTRKALPNLSPAKPIARISAMAKRLTA